MDKLVLAQKLESLRRCLQRIEQKRPATVAALETDADLQDVIVLNLTRAVQLSVDIASHIVSQSNEPSPSTMGETFLTLMHTASSTSQRQKACARLSASAISPYTTMKRSTGKSSSTFANENWGIFGNLPGR